uniref:Arabinogalactan peptide 23-like n=1 Tax=Nelumbo nucifera TaxID=4432 RepID=A0A822YB66_NELNU|nr:TPA_asm: hypothetical protein HUJ06_031278 [Nelumbo nucifera]
MAQVSIYKAAVLACLVMAILSAAAATASAQKNETAPASEPSMVPGSGFALSISGAVLCSSLFFSLLALLKLH